MIYRVEYELQWAPIIRTQFLVPTKGHHTFNSAASIHKMHELEAIVLVSLAAHCILETCSESWDRVCRAEAPCCQCNCSTTIYVLSTSACHPAARTHRWAAYVFRTPVPNAHSTRSQPHVTVSRYITSLTTCNFPRGTITSSCSTHGRIRRTIPSAISQPVWEPLPQISLQVIAANCPLRTEATWSLPHFISSHKSELEHNMMIHTTTGPYAAYSNLSALWNANAKQLRVLIEDIQIHLGQLPLLRDASIYIHCAPSCASRPHFRRALRLCTLLLYPWARTRGCAGTLGRVGHLGNALVRGRSCVDALDNDDGLASALSRWWMALWHLSL